MGGRKYLPGEQPKKKTNKGLEMEVAGSGLDNKGFEEAIVQ